MRMRKFRQQLKEQPQLEKLCDRLESNRSLERQQNHTDEQKERDKESAKIRMRRYTCRERQIAKLAEGATVTSKPRKSGTISSKDEAMADAKS